MNAVTVNRLRIKAGKSTPGRTAFLIEDALRTEVPTSKRLVLMRQLKLDRRAVSAAAHVRASAMRKAYAEETAKACHASSAASANANCVWFADAGEARRMLLFMLLKGQNVQGWYWRLAVPDWQGQSLSDWMWPRIERLLAASASAALLEIVADFSRLDALEKFVSIIVRYHGYISDTNEYFRKPNASLLSDRSDDITDNEIMIDGGVAASATIAYWRLPQPGRQLLILLCKSGPDAAAVAQKLAERLICSAIPSLSLHPGKLQLVATTMMLHLRSGELAMRQPLANLTEAAEHRQAGKDLTEQQDAEISEIRVRSKPETRLSAEVLKSKPEQSDNKDGTISEPENGGSEFWHRPALLESKAAGLWLLIPTMIKCGWREWLMDQPQLLIEDPGRLLLRHIAQHHRVGPADDSLAPLGEAGASDILSEWAFLWRRGLGGWLQRKTRINLHNLIWRPGKIGISEERMDIYFPLSAADIRLRRHALDIDPGWTDWLGLSVRYHFGGRAEE